MVLQTLRVALGGSSVGRAPRAAALQQAAGGVLRRRNAPLHRGSGVGQPRAGAEQRRAYGRALAHGREERVCQRAQLLHVDLRRLLLWLLLPLCPDGQRRGTARGWAIMCSASRVLSAARFAWHSIRDISAAPLRSSLPT